VIDQALGPRPSAGSGGAPKFPQAMTSGGCSTGTCARGQTGPLTASLHSLDAMARGGIHDHVAGGSHRYSTDAQWLVPHFEKMLYDNALLARLYLDAWRATGESDFVDVATETLDYVLTDLRAPEGGFYAARDADSEGEEGRFYLWTPSEIDAVAAAAGIEPDTAERFRRVYDVRPGGHLEGRSILHLPDGWEEAARREGVGSDVLSGELGPLGKALLDARARREPPFRDEKVLCSWNAFAVRALAEAGAVLDRRDYLDSARAAADFLLGALRPAGELHHVWTSGRVSVPAFLEDRAALANACLSLHEATLERRWLDAAEALCDELVERHFDSGEGLFFDDAPGSETLVVRPREVMDQATPSGTSLAVEALLRAGHVLDRDPWTALARAALDRERHAMARMPAGFGRLLTQVVRLEAPPVEVAVFGPADDPRTRALLSAALGDYQVARVVSGGDPAGGDLPETPLLAGRGEVDGAPAAWVCRSYACERPVADPEAVRRLLRA
jgi:uncharacterized protein